MSLIDKLDSLIELDVLIAEKVMGARWIDYRWYDGTIYKLLRYGDEEEQPRGSDFNHLPGNDRRIIEWGHSHYSSSIDAAFDVIEELREQHHIYLLRLSNGDTNWLCWLGTGITGPIAVSTVEDTASLAICKAALLAIEKLKEIKP